jgi:hypothetical protein
MFRGVCLAFRGPAPAGLRGFRLSGLTVPCEVSGFVAVVAIALRFLLEGPRGLSGLTILLRSGPCHPIYLVWMAILLFGCRDRLPLWRNAFYFLRSTPEIIIQACSLMNQGVPIGGKPLNRHRIFDIRPQSLIELRHFSALILINPE